MIDLIICASNNKRLAALVVKHGFLYGARLPGQVSQPLYFGDQDWKRPNRGVYMRALERHRPHLATVLDLERPAQLAEVLSWAEEASQYVQEVVIIPKYEGAIRHLPHEINGKRVRLAYSVPTKYGGTSVPVAEFAGWPVHLLGGKPQAQMALVSQMDVVSADGNVLLKAASYKNLYDGERWVRLAKYAGHREGPDLMWECIELSCANIMAAWQRFWENDQFPMF